MLRQSQIIHDTPDDALIALDDVQLAEISSLSLARVKVDIIKLDKTAVEQLIDGTDAKAVDTVRALALLPGLSIIGDCVEKKRRPLDWKASASNTHKASSFHG